MTIEDAFVAIAQADAGLVALLGAGTAIRFYPRTVPQDAAMPAVTFHCVSAENTVAMGVSGPPEVDRWQFSCWSIGDDLNDAKDVARAVRSAFDRWRGVAAGVTIQDIILDGSRDLPLDYEADRNHVAVDFRVFHEDSP